MAIQGERIQTQNRDGYVGVVEVDGLLPETYFSYDIFLNGKNMRMKVGVRFPYFS